MKRDLTYKFQLRPKAEQTTIMLKFAGSCRFIWNKALATEKESLSATGNNIGFIEMKKLFSQWRYEPETSFLVEVPSQILRQALRDIYGAFDGFFRKRAGMPKFKKKGDCTAFIYSEGVQIDENNSRVFLPKIGWVRYRDSRKIKGEIKKVTISSSGEKWSMSIMVEQEIRYKASKLQSAVGIYMDESCSATLTDGSMIQPIPSLSKQEKKLAKLKHDLSRKQQGAANWRKQKSKVDRCLKKIDDTWNDFLHKASTTISKNHAVVVLEDSKSNDRTSSVPSGINERNNLKPKKFLMIRNKFHHQLSYKTRWLGGKVVQVYPQHAIQKCNQCGSVATSNMNNQPRFRCFECGYEVDAGFNAALNILTVGQTVSACGVGTPNTRREAGTRL